MRSKIKYNYSLADPVINSQVKANINPVKWENTDGYILDEITGGVLVLSLRKMKQLSKYAIRVRRSNDNAEMDIGFVNGKLDKWTLMEFIGGNSGFVKVWYDPSGYGNNATQVILANQPRIVNSGVVDIDANGLPTIQTILANDTHFVVADSNSLDLVNSGTYSIVHTPDNAGEVAGRILDKGSYLLFMGSNSINASPPASISSGTGGAVFGEININTIPFETGTNSLKYYTNGALVTSVNSVTLTPNGSSMYVLNNSALTRQYDGKMLELLLFNIKLPHTQRKKLEKSQSKRYETTVV